MSTTCESTLSLDVSEAMNLTAWKLGYKRATNVGITVDTTTLSNNLVTWTNAQFQDIRRVVDEAYRSIAQNEAGYRFTWTQPSSTIIAWGDATGTGVTVATFGSDNAMTLDTAGTYSTTTGLTTGVVHDSGGDTFVANHVGLPLYYGTSGNSYTISSKTSTTTCVLVGDASGETLAQTLTIPKSVLTADDIFHPSMIDRAVTFDTSSTDYNVLKYVSGTVVILDGDASGESATDTLTITATGDYTFPPSVGGLVGPLTFDTDDNRIGPIDRRSEREIRHLRERSASTGPPVYAALRWRTTDGTDGQRMELMTWPIPDGDYTLGYTYDIILDALSNDTGGSYDDARYPFGGAYIGGLLKAACFAVIEQEDDDTEGPATAKFHRMLKGAIERDKMMTRPETLGRPAGVGRQAWGRDEARRSSGRYVVYNGQPSV